VPCRKYVSTRKCYNNGNTAASLTEHASSMWCLTSVFICPHVDEKPAFSKIFTLETIFEKIIYVFGDCFRKIRVDSRPYWRKNLCFQTCGRGLRQTNGAGPKGAFLRELTVLLYIMFHPTCLVVLMSLCETAVQEVHVAELQHPWNKHNQCSPQDLGKARGHSDKILI